MILVVNILFLLLSVWIVVLVVVPLDSSSELQKGFYSYLEPRFKVDRFARGCLARQMDLQNATQIQSKSP